MSYFKLIPTLMLCVLFLTSNAQQSFFEAITANGPDAIYQRYGSVYDDDKGKLVIGGKHGQFHIVAKEVQGVDSGFEVIAANDEIYKKGNRTAFMDLATEKSHRYQSYPNVSFVYNYRHRDFDDPWVAIGDYVFKLDGIYESGTGFSSIKEMYIKLGGDIPQATNADGGKKKKKKLGAFMNKLKDAALNKYPEEDAGSGPEWEYANSQDIKKMITDYLTQMKSKQSSYQLTAQDKKDMDILSGAADDYYAHVKNKNDAFWASPEGQAIKENNRRAEASDRATVVTLKNNSNRTIFVDTKGSNNPGTSISAGATASWRCKADAYVQTVTKTGSSSAYSTTSQKVYSANTGCGQTININ